MDNYLLFLYKLLSTMAGLVGWPYFFWHLKSRGQGESFWPRLGLKLPDEPTPPGFASPVAPRRLRGGDPGRHPPGPGTSNPPTPGGLHHQHRHRNRATSGPETLSRPRAPWSATFPWTTPWAVRRYLDYLRPQVFIGLESEIWPNFLSQAHQRGVRLALVNARLSDKSLRRFIKYSRYLSGIFDLYDVVAAGSRPDFQRWQRLGIAPSRLHLTGNLKYDRLLQGRDETRLQEFRGFLQGAQPNRVRSAGRYGWRPPPIRGKTSWWRTAYQELLAPYPALTLILAPRHPQRAPELVRLFRRRGLPCHLWTSLKAGRETRRHPVVIIDTIGDLFTLYGLADVTFVGGSLVPHGGQNILEPAAWGRVPIYGPHMGNFLWAQNILEEAGAGIVVHRRGGPGSGR